MKAHKQSVTFRIASDLRRSLETIAQQERRSFSNQINVVIEEWLRIRSQIHPQFKADIKEALKSGKPEPVWKG